jgi:glyoxylase-like metal-dependent hydrolase (beta-lactamase superfamily II)
VSPVPRELAPGVTQLATDYAHTCGLPLWLNVVEDGDGLVLLDSGTSQTTDAATEPELRSLGRELSDISLVVNSHAHPDHMGGNAVLAARTEARFAAPAVEVARLEDNATLVGELWDASPEAYTLTGADLDATLAFLGERVRIDVLLRAGDDIPAGDGALRVVETSGHSPGHIALLHEPTRVLFSFDDVQGRGIPFLDSDLWLGPLYEDVRRYRVGLQGLLELDFDLLVPSHGDPLDRDEGRKRVEASLTWVDDVDAHARALLKARGSLDIAELATSIGTELGPFGGICLQTVQMARAHLADLTREGLVAPRWSLPEGSRA